LYAAALPKALAFPGKPAGNTTRPPPSGDASIVDGRRRGTADWPTQSITHFDALMLQ
jgi:hypothetical protein